MKIAVLSGAIKNAGDYLIVSRSEKLLEHMYPGVELCKFVRNYSLEDQIEELNACDVAVFAGGPSYCRALYPDAVPLVKELSTLSVPLFMLGSGWYGNTTNPSEVFGYRFTEGTMRLFGRIAADGGGFGCRDWYAQRVLVNNGFEDTVMTGCPAWYDLACLDSDKTVPAGSPLKIAVSDPANIALYGSQSLDLVRQLIKFAPNATIKYFFHRGIKADALTDEKTAINIKRLTDGLTDLGVPFCDISYNAEGFEEYRKFDVHVGHRVHAHIYNLSIRHLSLLLEEDSRGAGVNEALGLFSTKAYGRKTLSTSPRLLRGVQRVLHYNRPNEFAVTELLSNLDYLLERDNSLYENAYRGMRAYFEVMKSHLRRIGEIVR